MKWIIKIPRPRIYASQYRIPAVAPLFRSSERVVVTYINDYTVLAIVHPPGAKLRITAYGSGLVRIGNTVIITKPEGTQAIVRGSRLGVTLIRVQPETVIYITVEILH
jgi:hypothetical protein